MQRYRVNVSLSANQYELISRLSRVQKRSRADVLRDLFETMAPVLERVVVVGEAAERAAVQAKEGFRESAERAEQAILPHVREAMGQFDAFVDDTIKGIGNAHGGAGGARRGQPPQAAPTAPLPSTGLRERLTRLRDVSRETERALAPKKGTPEPVTRGSGGGNDRRAVTSGRKGRSPKRRGSGR